MRRTLLLASLTLLLLAGLQWTSPEPVSAKGFIVDSSFDDADAHDANPGDGICADTFNACTLRAAVEESNAWPEVDTITFADTMQIFIDDGNGSLVVAHTVTIDASGVWDTVAGTPGVMINGKGGSFPGLAIRDDSCQVYGLHVTKFSTGIDISSSSNTVGGMGAGQRNVISGNGTGMAIRMGSAQSNIVRSNYIGLTPAGDAKDGNETGLIISLGAANNIIGGNEMAHANFISGNNDEGVVIEKAGTDNNWLASNVIGPGIDLAVDLGNGGEGVRIHDLAANTVLGGAGMGNMLGYNGQSGVLVNDAGSGTQISYNIIGANLRHGVEIERTAGCVIEGNWIHSNTRAGVAVFNASSVGNLIWPNSIHSNGDKGILLGPGANLGIVAPVITRATTRSVKGTLGCPGCTIAIYSDAVDEGLNYHGTTAAASDGSWLYLSPVLGPNVTATVTDIGDSTSEFSAPFDISAVKHTVFLPKVRR